MNIISKMREVFKQYGWSRTAGYGSEEEGFCILGSVYYSGTPGRQMITNRAEFEAKLANAMQPHLDGEAAEWFAYRRSLNEETGAFLAITGFNDNEHTTFEDVDLILKKVEVDWDDT